MKKVVANGWPVMAGQPFSSDSASCQTTKQAAFWAACLVVGTFPAVAFAADQTFDTASTPPEIWQPPSFDVQQWDWIQLDTGEWVKGRIKVLHEESVEIDSDHFDLISSKIRETTWIRVIENSKRQGCAEGMESYLSTTPRTIVNASPTKS